MSKFFNSLLLGIIPGVAVYWPTVMKMSAILTR
jgi:hypothetical protein